MRPIAMRPIATACLDAYIMNHWTLVVVNLTKGAAFWIDPLKNRMDRDVTEVVERYVILTFTFTSFFLNETIVYVVQTPILFCRSFNIMNKKKPNWRVVKMKDSPRAYTKDDIDCIRSKWAEFCVVDHEVLLKCVVDKKMLSKCVVDLEVMLSMCVVDHEVLLIMKCYSSVMLSMCVVDHEVLLKLLLKCVVDKIVMLKCVVHHEVLLECVVEVCSMLLKCVVHHEVNVLPQSIGAMKPYLCQFIDV
ncbi:hypothetical protein IC582_024068 [Cucumis melo]